MNLKNSVNLKFMKQNNLLIACFLLFSLGHAAGQRMTLDQLLQEVERNNPMLAGFQAKAEAKKEYAAGAKAWMAPMAGIGTFMTPYPRLSGDGNSMTDGDQDNEGSLMISVEQTIPNKHKLDASRKYMLEQSKGEELKRSQQWNELRYQTREAFVIWSMGLEKLKKISETQQILQFMIESAEIRLRTNQGSPAAVYRTQARLGELKNMQSMIESSIEESKSRLLSLMNFPSISEFSIDPSLSLIDWLIQPDTSSLAQKRSDVKGIDQEISVMQLNQRLQSLQNKPDVRLRFDHMQSYGSMPNQFTAMAMFTIPVAPWSAKMYQAEVAGMSKEIQAMKQERAAILQETKGMLNRMGIQISNMKSQLARYENEILPALKRNYESLKISWEENREQLPMVLDGLEALTMAEQEYLEKKESLYIMIASYEKLIEE